MQLERLSTASKRASFEQRDSLKDRLFDQYMKMRMVDDFFESAEEYWDENFIKAAQLELSDYSDNDVLGALSIPCELRERVFTLLRNRCGDDGGAAMRHLRDLARKNGFRVGYHTSPRDIRPSKNGEWTIDGFEQDHRDADLSKAYYSTRYSHLYKYKDPQYIYIVRVDPETHRTDGNWSRAGRLSIVMRLPYDDVVRYVESMSDTMVSPDSIK